MRGQHQLVKRCDRSRTVPIIKFSLPIYESCFRRI